MMKLVWRPLAQTAQRHHCVLCDWFFLLAVAVTAALIAVQFGIPGGTAAPMHQQLLQLEEALILAALFCVGLVGVAWFFFRNQQRTVASRISAARAAQDLALQDLLTGLVRPRHPAGEPVAALQALPRTEVLTPAFA